MARRSWQDDLLQVFSSFAAFGAGRAAGPPELDGAKLAKLARETSILDKVLTTTQVDLIFARVKRKGERKIGFDDFLEACAQMAAIKYPGDAEGFDRIVLKILEAGGPSSSATAVAAADGVYSKLTDAGLYTGAHKARFDAETGAGLGLAGRDAIATGGGTHTVYHGGAVSDLSQVTRSGMGGGTSLSSASVARSAAPTSARTAGSPAAPAPSGSLSARAATGGAGATGSPYGGASAAPRAAAPAPAATVSSPAAHAPGGDTELGYSLFDVFVAYCTFGGTSAVDDEIDNAKFAKLCRESGIQDGKRVTPASVDITFSKVKDKGRRTIGFDRFQEAVGMLAAEKFPTLPAEAAFQAACAQILAAGGPALVGASKARTDGVYGKLTDAGLYTGAHKERFDGAGHGLGLAGRDSVATGSAPGRYHGGAVKDLSQITRSNLN